MRALLSTIGSRGEAQPVVALAVQLIRLGHEAVVCAPPDFQRWAESLGVSYVPVGPEVRGTARPAARSVPTPEQRRQMIEGTVAGQFQALGPASDGCDVVLGGGGLAIAAHSIADWLGVPYVYAAFAPITLPSPYHAPPVFGLLGQGRDGVSAEITDLWAEDERRWNASWQAPLNSQRGRLGLPPVEDVRSHLFTASPWLAADPVLAPWPGSPDLDVFQTGVWLLDDTRPLDSEFVAFLDAGEPPIYCGFGSVRAPEGITRTVIETARSFGRRVVISRGWADLDLVDNEPDCIVVSEVNQRALFTRVAAVVQHGGAGTTTAAAIAGVPQVVLPQMFDQHYNADRVERLGIGAALAGAPTAEALRAALQRAMDDGTVANARSVAAKVTTDGASRAAKTLIALAQR